METANTNNKSLKFNDKELVIHKFMNKLEDDIKKGKYKLNIKKTPQNKKIEKINTELIDGFVLV